MGARARAQRRCERAHDRKSEAFCFIQLGAPSMRELTRRHRVLQSVFAAVLLLFCANSCSRHVSLATPPGAAPAPASTSAVVLPGVDVWLTSDIGDLAGKSVGLITNHTGLTRDGR